MSNKRLPSILCPRYSTAPIATLIYDFTDGHRIPEHSHPEDQLAYASRGVMTVHTPQGSWVVPAQRAVWIPAKTPHSIVMSGAVFMRTLYLRPRLAQRLPRDCRVVNVTPLLRELILHACQFRELRRRVRNHAHLIDLIVDQLEAVETVPLQLTHPSDPRALRVAEALSKDIGEQCSLEQVCKNAGASKRTIERLFQEETQLTLGKWRQQLRLMRSLRLLAAGEKITHAALEAGYSTPSAFVAMFKKTLGTTPRCYFSESANGHP